MPIAETTERVMQNRPNLDKGSSAQPNPRRLKRGSYTPAAETLALLKVSGNPINGH